MSNTLEEFGNAIARGGLEAGAKFVGKLPEEQKRLLIVELEDGGAGWVAAWLTLRTISDAAAEALAGIDEGEVVAPPPAVLQALREQS